MHSDWISLVQDLIEARMMAQFQSEVNIMMSIDLMYGFQIFS